MRVKEVMTPRVYAVRPETPLKTVAVLLVQRGIGAVPVVDEDEKPIGILTEADLLKLESRSDPRLHARRDDACGPVPHTAADAMSSPVFTVGPGTDMADLVHLMLTEQLTRVPVIGHDGRLMGIVSRSDLLRPLARPDSDIATDLRRLVDLLPVGFVRTMTVRDGEVSAAVNPSTDTSLLERMVRTVPGVMDVRVETVAP